MARRHGHSKEQILEALQKTEVRTAVMDVWHWRAEVLLVEIKVCGAGCERVA